MVTLKASKKVFFLILGIFGSIYHVQAKQLMILMCQYGLMIDHQMVCCGG